MIYALILLAIVTFPIWGLILLLFGFALWMSVMWALGVRITITHKGKSIGYVRWFKFYKV